MRGLQQQQQHASSARHAAAAAPEALLLPAPRCVAYSSPALHAPALVARQAPPAASRSAVRAAATSTATAVSVGTTYVSREARAALFGRAKEAPETEASITGSIPSWLSGSLIVNGGADYTGMNHMFDGYAMLTKFRFHQGRVWGSQKYTQSDAYKQFASTGKMRYSEFGTPPNKSAPTWQRLLETTMIMASGQGIVTDNPSVNVVPLPDGRLLAVSESIPSLYQMDPSTLQTLKQVTYTDGVAGALTTAHPKIMGDGTIVNFTRSLPFGGFHVYKQDPVTLQRKEIAFIKDRLPLTPAWVHDMAISRDHLIIIENPLFMSLAALVAGSVETCFEWKPELGTVVHVIPLKEDAGAVRSYQAPAFFTFHTANAFEKDGQLLVDMAVYDDDKVVTELSLDRLLAFPGQDISPAGMRRLTIPLSGSASAPLAMPTPLAKDEAHTGYFAEFPCFNNGFKGQQYRYVWANAAKRPTNMSNALMKLDTHTGEVKLWHEEGALPSGPTFVAAPNSKSEDDGVIVSVVMAKNGTSYVLTLDASSMRELGRAQLPYAVPYRFHGAFVPSNSA